MRSNPIRLYSLAAPLAFLPVLNFSFSKVPGWFLGTEFRTMLSEILVQIFSGISDAILLVLAGSLFGTPVG